MNAPFRVKITPTTAISTRLHRLVDVARRARLILALVTASGAALSCTSHPGTEAASAPQSPLPLIELGTGIVVDRSAGEVRVEAEVAADRGWLEQAVCKAGTREHESLLAVTVAPSRIHAALLLLGLQPGAPGEWRVAPGGSSAVQRIAPTGTPLELWVRTSSGDVPLSSWIHDPVKGHSFPGHPWVFAGSRVRSNTKSMGPGEYYLADRTGSVVGIVTFGDETIACTSVISDQAEVDAPEWQAKSERMPEPGTRVELVIRRGHDVAPATPATAATPAPPAGAAP